MSGTDPHYRNKLFFWKWKTREGVASSASASGEGKTPFWTSWSGSLLIHAVVILLLLTAFRIHRPAMRAVHGRLGGEVSLVFSDEEPGGGGESTKESDVAGSSTENRPDGGPTAEAESGIDEKVPSGDELIGTGETGGVTARIRFAETGASEGEGGSVKTGNPNAAGDGNGQTVRFGELSGRGERFLYLIDRSESMKWPDGVPLNFAVSEARQSVASLDPKEGAQKFQLLVFNHHVEVLDGGRRLLDVTDESKRRADEFLRSVRPEGGTDPLGALSAAIRMAPDVIFFLTDAEEEISALTLRRVHDLARRTGVSQIHVIEFGKPGGKHPAAYRKLAEENGGTHIYKDVTSLK